MTFTEAAALPSHELARLLRITPPFNPAHLAGINGATYRGISVGLPSWLERVLWRQFAKHFAPNGRGFNLRVVQDTTAALDAPWRLQRHRDGRAQTFGPFVISGTVHGVELDYSIANPVMRRLRDPLVALDAAADVVAGCSLVAVGNRRLATPSFFVLGRDAALTRQHLGD